MRWIAVFVPVVWLCYPWEWYVLPHPGALLSGPASGAAHFTGAHLLGLSSLALYSIQSDSTGLYVHCANAALVAAFVVTVWTARRRIPEQWLLPLVSAVLRYILAIALLAYGLNKLFKHQFFLPEPNTLYTSLGQVPRDLLYWSTMGVSRPYSIFLGVCEVVPALLLMHSRTARAGAWVAAAVLVNVVAVNFCYDISVKVMSSFLTLVALCIALVHRPHIPRAVPGRAGLVMKWALVALVIADALYPYIRSRNFDDDAAPRPPLHGAYAIVSSSHKAIPRPQRIFFHLRGYLIIEDSVGGLRDYEMTLDTARRTISLTGPYTLHYSSTKGGLLLRGQLFGSDSATVLAKPLPWKKLPLLREEFHWTVDEL